MLSVECVPSEKTHSTFNIQHLTFRMSHRLPSWIREKKLNLGGLHEIKSLLREKKLHSVCELLACPNRTECFTRGTATFMILGDVCTRACGFCNVTTGRPYAAPSPDEPRAVAEAARR